MKEYSSEKDLYILAKELAYKFTLDKYKTFLIQHELIQKDLLDEPFGRFSKIIVKEEYIRETLMFLWPGEKFDELIEILYGEEMTAKPIGFESISKQVTPKSKGPDNITKSMPAVDRKLRVFLCHSSQDKPIVRDLYQRLNAEGWIDPWLDEEKLLPGQDWDLEIERAVEAADAVLVCLSAHSVTKEGYVQRELRFVLDVALEKPEGTVFIVPLRLDDCQPPRRLRTLQYLDYFPVERRKWATTRLIESLKTRLNSLIPDLPQNNIVDRPNSAIIEPKSITQSKVQKTSMPEFPQVVKPTIQFPPFFQWIALAIVGYLIQGFLFGIFASGLGLNYYYDKVLLIILQMIFYLGGGLLLTYIQGRVFAQYRSGSIKYWKVIGSFSWVVYFMFLALDVYLYSPTQESISTLIVGIDLMFLGTMQLFFVPYLFFKK